MLAPRGLKEARGQMLTQSVPGQRVWRRNRAVQGLFPFEFFHWYKQRYGPYVSSVIQRIKNRDKRAVSTRQSMGRETKKQVA